MRILILFLVFFAGVFSYSQHVVAGFYEVNSDKKGILLKADANDGFYHVRPEPILLLSDVEKMRSGKIANDLTYSLTFSLTESSTEKMIQFSKTKMPKKLALVLQDTVVKVASLNMPLTNQFSMDGFGKKQAKILRKRLKVIKDNPMGTYYLYVSGDFKLSRNKATHGETELYSAIADHDGFVKRESNPDAKCPPVYTGYYNPLSLVGKYYSYEYGNKAAASCVRLGSTVGVKTIDIVSGEEVSLLAFFEEADIVTAFKKEDWVQQMATSAQMDLSKIETFQEVLDFNSGSSAMSFGASAFCIVGFQEGIAKVKFVGRGYVGGNSYLHAPMNFELPVKQDALEWFENESNFYLGTYNNGLLKDM